MVLGGGVPAGTFESQKVIQGGCGVQGCRGQDLEERTLQPVSLGLLPGGEGR